jgi:hypothetical protein
MSGEELFVTELIADSKHMEGLASAERVRFSW